MDVAFTEEQEEIRRTLRELLRKRCGPDEVKSAARTPEGRDGALWRLLARSLGLPGLALPAAYGGAGCGLAELVLACEETGRALLPSPLLGTTVLTAPSSRRSAPTSSAAPCSRASPPGSPRPLPHPWSPSASPAQTPVTGRAAGARGAYRRAGRTGSGGCTGRRTRCSGAPAPGCCWWPPIRVATPAAGSGSSSSPATLRAWSAGG